MNLLMRELKKNLLTAIMVINPVRHYSQISETKMLCICCANTKKRNELGLFGSGGGI